MPEQDKTDMPFLSPIAGQPDIFALCYPANRFDRPRCHCYMLDDGTTICAKEGRWTDGSPEGWREIAPGQFEGRVIGRVVSLHGKDRAGWCQIGTVYLPWLDAAKGS
jgi:hypothetical protein